MKPIVFAVVALLGLPACAQQPVTVASAPAVSSADVPHLRAGMKLYIEPMNGFENYLSAALLRKKVPVLVVDKPENADAIVTGTWQTQAAGWAKTIFVSPAPHATASITIKDAHSGVLEFAYSVDKSNAVRASQSTAEACAKHLKQAIAKG